jgi:5-methylcytosine-specific restriction protein A
MTNLITQPYRRPKNSNDDNYLVTLAKEFNLVSAVKAAGVATKVNLSNFMNVHPSGKSRLWAVGTSAPGKRAYEKMTPGDLVVFYGSSEIYAYGEISSKLVWKNNNYIWPSGQNWDFIYSVKNFHELSEGERPLYQELRKVLSKLDVQSVGVRSLYEAGISKAELLDFLLNDAKKSPKKISKHAGNIKSQRDVSQFPPKLGEKFINRKAIWEEFGGQWQQGITTFPNDNYLNVFSDEEGPYPDYQDPVSGIIEYRGQGLSGNQKLSHGNKLIENARLSKNPVRFWFKPAGGAWVFYKWVIVSDREPIVELDSLGNKAKRVLWYLTPVNSPNASEWPAEITDLPILELPEATQSSPPKSPETFIDRYLTLVKDSPNQPQSKTTSAPRTNYKRSRKLRQIVIERANNLCEFDGCTGMPFDLKIDGSAILEVDHIDALGEGGIDHPSNMVALCPNCHESKTHGRGKSKMVKKLKQIVIKKESNLLGLNLANTPEAKPQSP